MAGIKWLIPAPSRARVAYLADFCETVARQSANKLGCNNAEIRSLPHTTTRRNGKMYQIQNHITLNWYNVSLDKKGKAVITDEKQGECFVDKDNTRMLQDHELDANTKALNANSQNPSSNPSTWPGRK